MKLSDLRLKIGASALLVSIVSMVTFGGSVALAMTATFPAGTNPALGVPELYVSDPAVGAPGDRSSYSLVTNTSTSMTGSLRNPSDLYTQDAYLDVQSGNTFVMKRTGSNHNIWVEKYNIVTGTMQPTAITSTASFAVAGGGANNGVKMCLGKGALAIAYNISGPDISPLLRTRLFLRSTDDAASYEVSIPGATTDRQVLNLTCTATNVYFTVGITGSPVKVYKVALKPWLTPVATQVVSAAIQANVEYFQPCGGQFSKDTAVAYMTSNDVSVPLNVRQKIVVVNYGTKVAKYYPYQIPNSGNNPRGINCLTTPDGKNVVVSTTGDYIDEGTSLRDTKAYSLTTGNALAHLFDSDLRLHGWVGSNITY